MNTIKRMCGCLTVELQPDEEFCTKCLAAQAGVRRDLLSLAAGRTGSRGWSAIAVGNAEAMEAVAGTLDALDAAEYGLEVLENGRVAVVHEATGDRMTIEDTLAEATSEMIKLNGAA